MEGKEEDSTETRKYKNKNLDNSLFNEFGDLMRDTDLGSMSASMMELGEELKETLDKWTENRKGWVTDEVCRSVRRRRHDNKEYRKMRRVCGVNDERTEKKVLRQIMLKRKKIQRRL